MEIFVLIDLMFQICRFQISNTKKIGRFGLNITASNLTDGCCYIHNGAGLALQILSHSICGEILPHFDVNNVFLA